VTNEDSRQSWSPEWLRGALELCVLGIISRGTTYGYQIATELTAARLGNIKGGTLYPLLARLEESGLVLVEWRAGKSGPARKYYALSPAGQERFNKRRQAWLEFTRVVGDVVEPPITTTGNNPESPMEPRKGMQ
jgi:PadR family transcriptional regulator PadR